MSVLFEIIYQLYFSRALFYSCRLVSSIFFFLAIKKNKPLVLLKTQASKQILEELINTTERLTRLVVLLNLFTNV